MKTTVPAPRIGASLLLAALVAASSAMASPRHAEATGPADAARAHLAGSQGGTAADWELVYERDITAPDGAPMWVGKLVNATTGELDTVYRAADGSMGGPELFTARTQAAVAALSAMAAKAGEALQGAVAAAKPEAKLPVAVWLSADPGPAVAAAIASHPEVEWRGERPVIDDLAGLRAVRAELDAARSGAYASVQEAFRTRIEALGGTIAYASTSAPLVFVDLPAGSVAALAAEKGVESLALEQAWQPSMTSAGPAVDANWTGGGGDQGTGVRVGVVEYHNVRPGGDLSGRVVASHSTTGALAYAGGGTFDHPTWVAGAVASRSSTWAGVAPGALIVSSGTGGYHPSLSTDRAIVAAADWAIAASGGDADIVNTSLVQDTATGAEEARRYFDAIAYEGGRLPISAAGNFSNGIGWQVGSPGTGWNVLTVGGIDDRGTGGRGDDRIWYVPGSNGSNFLDPAGTSWNAHGDFNKPNLSAPAVGVRTANGLAASGTSVATPIVAGIAAQVMARSPTLAAWPEAMRAILMASSVHRTRMPDGSVNVDHEGAGTASALWANRIIGQSDGIHGGMTFGTMQAGQRPAVNIAVAAGQRVRVALAWSSHTSGSALGKSDVLTADLDLRVVLPNGATAGSYTLDNANEWVEFTAPSAGTARIEVLTDRFDAASEPFGLAWAKLPPPIAISRLAGPDRYGTAAAISRAGYRDGSDTVFIATGATFPDALGAGPAAARAAAPILLVTRTGIPAATATELHRLTPDRITIVGGTGAVSSSVASALRAYAPTVTRIGGTDRYATAAAVATATFAPGIPLVFIATGANFPDALAGSAAAASRDVPILLTTASHIPSSTASALAKLDPASIVVLGSAAVVSDAVASQLRAHAPVTRIAGPDRYATAAAIVAAYFPSAPSAWLGTGAAFPDALAAAPLAGRSDRPLLLTMPTKLPPATRGQLVRLRPARVYVVGSGGAVSEGVVNAVRTALGP